MGFPLAIASAAILIISDHKSGNSVITLELENYSHHFSVTDEPY